MAIDFNLLNASAPKTGVVANIPQRPNNLDQLASGLLSGAQAGQQIAASRQQVAASQQQQQQQAQMFPQQLQQAKDATTIADMGVQQAVAGQKSAAEIKQAFNQGWDTGMDQLKKSDPVTYLKTQAMIDTHQKAMTDISEKMGKNKKDALDIYNAQTVAGSNLAEAAQQAEQKQPGSGDAVYQQGLKMLGPSIAATMPEKFDPSTYMSLHYLGAQTKLDQLAKADSKNGTPAAIQTAQYTGQLKTLVDSGKASPEQQNTYEALSQGNKKQGDSLVDKGEQQTTIASLKGVDKLADSAQASSTTIDMMDAINKQASSGSFANAEVTGKKFLSAASQALGLPYDPSTGVEEGFKHLSTLGRFDVLQNLRGRPNLVEFQQSLDSVPQITNTPQGRTLMISMAQYKNASASAYRDFSHEWAVNHNYSLNGRDDAWNNFQASIKSGYDPKAKTFDPTKLSSGNWRKFVTDPELSKPDAISPITGKPQGQFDNKEEFNKWFSAQPADKQADIKANPSKYGIK